jgi:outer membrane protein OmpA-like peptidoglycan-associated protein
LDFGPAYYKDKVVFASTRRKSGMIVRNYNWTGQPFWDMYVTDTNGVQLQNMKSFNKGMNGKLHDGPASFSKDGNAIAFTRNNYKDKTKDKVVELQIFLSNYADGKWSKPASFSHNSPEYSVGQPCLSADGKTMYFTSDKAGGYGGADLYRTSRDINGKWGLAENLGDKINTEGDEMFPFFHESKGILYFSSNGRFGLGGLDIFTSNYNGTGFEPAVNAGYPLNSQFNDYGIIANDPMNRGYFTSDRNGDDDIYSTEIHKHDGRLDMLVIAPTNVVSERKVRETFPLRNYVFFNQGSTEIPDRYVLLTKDQVKDFKEDQLEVYAPRTLSGRSDRQMTVYYNILNIVGDRMGKNPKASIHLAGSSLKGKEDGKLMANVVKNYLVNVFSINPNRISVEGLDKPVIPSEQPGGVNELDLLREGDQRVSIGSSSAAMLMEFQSGPAAPLKPVEIVAVQEDPIESFVQVQLSHNVQAINSWTLEIKDDKGTVQNFGPYTRESIRIPGKTILGTKQEGVYKVSMTAQTKNNELIKLDTTVHMVLWSPPVSEEITRFSIIYEFNDYKAIKIYEKYLTDVVVPKITPGGSVIIHGYTDIIGNDIHNQNLSDSRAHDVETILLKGLKKLGTENVKIEVYGYGEDINSAPFNNKYPEERFYNRTVIIDIIPERTKIVQK